MPPQLATIHDPDGISFGARVARTEHPGRWFFPLLATLVAAGGRLKLATLMHLVAQAGGQLAYCGT